MVTKKTVLAVLTAAFSTCVNANVTLYPEQNQVLEISSTDANRIHCGAGDINSVVYSKEKPVTVIPGDDRNAYIKFKMQKEKGGITYANEEAEFYFTCNGQIYPFIAIPTQMRPVTIVLSAGKTGNIKENIAMFSGLSMEEAVVELMDKVMLADAETPLPGTFSVEDAKGHAAIQVLPGVRAEPNKSVQVEGVGFTLKEYLVRSNTNATLEEMDFVNVAFGKNIVGVRLMDLSLVPGESTRLFVVERDWR